MGVRSCKMITQSGVKNELVIAQGNWGCLEVQGCCDLSGGSLVIGAVILEVRRRKSGGQYGPTLKSVSESWHIVNNCKMSKTLVL